MCSKAHCGKNSYQPVSYTHLKDLGTDVTAVLLGSNVKGLTDELGEYGADKVIVVDNPELETYRTAVSYTHLDVYKRQGMENMSMAPYAMTKARFGYRMNNATIIDTMVNDCLLYTSRCV